MYAGNGGDAGAVQSEGSTHLVTTCMYSLYAHMYERK